jgi:plasmid stabilization system protein ParE
MVSKKLKVIIDEQARKSLREAYNYIKKDSLQNAEKVRAEILATIKELPKNPQRHKPDNYRIKNEDSSYRAFEVYKY